ncbi:MAG: PEP-CTERM sorting domain-containing protein, partial [Pirellulales bacterium]|nr:PEP-CTERM sorting domain-containing protein [Pirellulales bacterium]
PHTGSGTGTLRITINDGVLQGEDLIYTGHTPDSLLILTGGELRINGSAITEADMLALITAGDISCPNGYLISTDGDYTVLTSAGTVVPGDATGDGKVDADDARRMAENWLKTGMGWAQGNFNGDDIVDDLDASILAANWGYGTEGVGVPEPGSFVLLLGLIAGAALWRSRQRKSVRDA